MRRARACALCAFGTACAADGKNDHTAQRPGRCAQILEFFSLMEVMRFEITKEYNFAKEMENRSAPAAPIAPEWNRIGIAIRSCSVCVQSSIRGCAAVADSIRSLRVAIPMRCARPRSESGGPMG